MGLSAISTIFIISTKYACIYWNQTKLKKILQLTTQEFSNAESDENNFHQVQRNYLRFVKFYVAYVFSSLIFVAQGPLASFLTEGKKTFPLQTEFLFDAFGTFVYPILLCWVVLAHTTHLFCFIVDDIFLYGFTTYLSMEFDALNSRFRKLREIEDEIEKIAKLKQIIERHNQLFNIVAEIQTIFAVSFFFAFILSSFIICFTAFQASTATDTISMIFNAMFCLICTNQIFMQCYFGQMLKNASENVLEGIYACGWEQAKSLEMKKDLIMLLRRVHKPAAYQILNYSPITLEQFQSVRKLFF